MKKKKTLLRLICITGALLINCITFAQTDMKLKIDKSKVEWTGKKVTGAHNGTISLKSGELKMNGTDILGGEFVMDMTTIKNEDIKNEKYREDLVNHLNSSDFFNVTEFPEAVLVIKESKRLVEDKFMIKGDLTIKGMTKPIEFNFDVHKHGEVYHMKGLMVINRTLYGIRYGSGSFFDNLGDKAINDNFELKFELEF